MKLLRSLNRAITAVVEGFLAVGFVAMLGLAALQVFLRFFFHTGIVWGDVAARYLVIWVGFFGAYLATREGKHFHVDALVRLFPFRIRFWCRAVTDLFAAFVCGFLLRASITFVQVGIDPGSILFLGIPEWIPATIVPVGFGLLTLEFFTHAAVSLASLFQGKSNKGAA